MGRKKRKRIDLVNRTVLIPGDVYQQQGIWYKGVVSSRSKYTEKGKSHWGWKVVFPPEEGKTKNQVEIWETQKLMQYLVPGHLTAADLDCGRVVEPLDTVLPLQVYDHVFADFRNTDNYFYGDIATVCGDEGERIYTVLFEDGDVETNITRERIVFLGRPGPGEVSDEMKSSIDMAVQSKVNNNSRIDDDDDDDEVEYLGSIIDLVGGREIADPEMGEITGHTDTI